MAEDGKIPGTIDLGVSEFFGENVIDPAVDALTGPVKDAADAATDYADDIKNIFKMPDLGKMIPNLGIPDLYDLEEYLIERMDRRIKFITKHASNSKERNKKEVIQLRALAVTMSITLMGAALYLANSQDLIIELSRSMARFTEPIIPTTDEIVEAVGGVAGGKIR
jgi:hypothetical protein